MSKINVSPEEMVSIAGQLDGLIAEWQSSVQKIISDVQELDAMWDGMSNTAFNSTLQNEDIPKLQRLAEMMAQYSEAIKVIAQRYVETDEAVGKIVGRC